MTNNNTMNIKDLFNFLEGSWERWDIIDITKQLTGYLKRVNEEYSRYPLDHTTTFDWGYQMIPITHTIPFYYPFSFGREDFKKCIIEDNETPLFFVKTTLSFKSFIKTLNKGQFLKQMNLQPGEEGEVAIFEDPSKIVGKEEIETENTEIISSTMFEAHQMDSDDGKEKFFSEITDILNVFATFIKGFNGINKILKANQPDVSIVELDGNEAAIGKMLTFRNPSPKSSVTLNFYLPETHAKFVIGMSQQELVFMQQKFMETVPLQEYEYLLQKYVNVSSDHSIRSYNQCKEFIHKIAISNKQNTLNRFELAESPELSHIFRIYSEHKEVPIFIADFDLDPSDFVVEKVYQDENIDDEEPSRFSVRMRN